jgi:hypothetical protein
LSDLDLCRERLTTAEVGPEADLRSQVCGEILKQRVERSGAKLDAINIGSKSQG